MAETRNVDYRYLSESGMLGYNTLSGLGSLLQFDNVISIDEFGQLYSPYFRYTYIGYTDSIGVDLSGGDSQKDLYLTLNNGTAEDVQIIDYLVPLVLELLISLFDDVNISDAVVLQSDSYQTLLETLSIIDSLVSIGDYRRVALDSLAIADSWALQSDTFRFLTDSINFLEMVKKEYQFATKTEHLFMYDKLYRGFSNSIVDLITLADSIEHALAYSNSDNVAVSEILLKMLSQSKFDVFSVIDELQYVINNVILKLLPYSRVYVSDEFHSSLSKSLVGLLSVGDVLEYARQYSEFDITEISDILKLVLSRSKSDAFELSDSLKLLIGKIKTDSVALSEILKVRLDKIESDSVSVVDLLVSVFTEYTANHRLETINILDSLVSVFAVFRNKGENLTVIDNLMISCIFRTIFQSAIEIADDCGVVSQYSRLYGSTVTVYDRLLRSDIIEPPLSYNTALQIHLQVNGEDYSENDSIERTIDLQIIESIVEN